MTAAGDDAAAVGPLHLLKMAVGIADIEELRRVRAERSRQYCGSWVYTRNHPRREAAVLAGGSLYWVMRGQIRVRQRISGFRSERDDKGRAYCLIGLDGELVPTLARRWRPFQGWRYLAAADAPPDLAPGLPPGAPAGVPAGAREGAPDGAPDGMPGFAEAPLPEGLLAELRALGLL